MDWFDVRYAICTNVKIVRTLYTLCTVVPPSAVPCRANASFINLLRSSSRQDLTSFRQKILQGSLIFLRILNPQSSIRSADMTSSEHDGLSNSPLTAISTSPGIENYTLVLGHLHIFSSNNLQVKLPLFTLCSFAQVEHARVVCSSR